MKNPQNFFGTVISVCNLMTYFKSFSVFLIVLKASKSSNHLLTSHFLLFHCIQTTLKSFKTLKKVKNIIYKKSIEAQNLKTNWYKTSNYCENFHPSLLFINLSNEFDNKKEEEESPHVTSKLTKHKTNISVLI